MTGIQLDEVFKDQQFGETRVVDARQTMGPIRCGRQLLFLDLVLSDPREDRWPSADVASIRQRSSEIARAAGDHNLDARLSSQ